MGRRKGSQKVQGKSNNAAQRIPLPLVVALITVAGAIIVAIINWISAVTATLKPIEATQTAETIHTSIALETQAYIIHETGTAAALPTPTFTPAVTDMPTNVSPTISDTPDTLLADVFPQRGEGQEYTFGDEVFSREFLDSGNCAHDGVYGLQLNYAMQEDEDFGGWGVQWETSSTGYLDLSAFDSITFWVKGFSGAETFQIVIADTDKADQSVKIHELVPITTEWTQVTVPLSQYNPVNLASVRLIEFAFYRRDGSGSICVDDIAFVP